MSHTLRRAGTGFLFAVFGVGGLAIAGVAFPLLAWRKNAGAERELAAQRIVYRACRAFVNLGVAMGLFELRESGTQRLLGPSALVVATHPTLLDVVFLLSRMPQADCIVKEEAWRNPFLRHVVSVAGYVPNAGGSRVVDACVQRLRAGRSVIVFPEGSRSPEHGLRPFKRGAAHVALRSGMPVTPVAISCAPPALKKGQPWWDVPDRKLVVRLEVEAPFRFEVEGGELMSRAARRVTAVLRAYFESKRSHGEA